jgi:3-mercaptopyruvate sulfurtransferase SseA
MSASSLVHWTTTIPAGELAAAIDHCVVVDCRHDLFDLEAGRRAYAAGHIPGAYFMHQDDDLSGPRTGRNGRHPLPDREVFAARLRAIGLNRDQQLVGYDDQGGMLASRCSTAASPPGSGWAFRSAPARPTPSPAISPRRLRSQLHSPPKTS